MASAAAAAFAAIRGLLSARVTPSPIAKAIPQAASNFVLAVLCSGSLLASPLPSSAAPSLNDAIVEVSESSYPILKALQADTFPPFSEKVGKLVLDIKPDKLGQSIGLGIDVFLSPPPEKLDAFKKTVKDSLADLDPSSCTLVPLPSVSLADKFTTVAKENVAADKLKAFDEAYGKTLDALPKTKDNSAICLPPVEKLDALALAQADLARSFAPEPSAAFAKFTTPVLKQSISIGKVLPLVNDAKKLAPSATPKEVTAFQNAGKKIEAAAKAETQRVTLEKLKEKKAAAEAARLAGKPAAPAQSAASQEAAARNEAARKEALARQEAVAQAKKEAQAAALKEQEARIEELKAQAAAKRELAAKEAEAKKAAEAAKVEELKAKAAAFRAAQAAAQAGK
jgi:hypothetical protein